MPYAIRPPGTPYRTRGSTHRNRPAAGEAAPTGPNPPPPPPAATNPPPPPAQQTPPPPPKIQKPRPRRPPPHGPAPAHRMPGQPLRLRRAEHRCPAAELGLGLGIVEPGVTAGDDEQHALSHPQRQRLGDPPGFHPERRRRFRHRRGTCRLLDQPEIGRMFGKPRADGFYGQSSIFFLNVSGSSNRPRMKVQAAATTGYQSP